MVYTRGMSRAEVLEKLVDQRIKRGDGFHARNRAVVELEHFERAGLTVLPCTVREFIARAGLLVLDPEAPEAHEMVARMLHGGTWWDDPTYQGSETLRRTYIWEASELLRALRGIQSQERAIEAGG